MSGETEPLAIDLPGEVPLQRADPRLIQELFDKDPLSLTDVDLDLIIADFRADRANYIQADKGKAKKAATAKASKAPLIPVSDQLDLTDLGL